MKLIEDGAIWACAKSSVELRSATLAIPYGEK